MNTDKLTDKDLCILPAIFARSNMGLGLPTQKQVDQDKSYTRPGFPPTLHGCVIHYCGEFMESDEHEQGFLDEARDWAKMLRKDGKKLICETHPDIAALYWGANDPVVKAGAKVAKARWAKIRGRK